MEIKKVSIIGLGALGILFGSQMLGKIPEGDLRIVAENQRAERYKRDGIFCNDRRCGFQYITPDESCEPADLLIFAVKFNGLADAIPAVKNHVGPNTVILSLLNGISSESIIGAVYGIEKILYCVAQGMDAVKVGNRLTYQSPGMLCFGELESNSPSQRMKDLAGFFDKVGIPYEMQSDMKRHMWGKFMLNVGVNQTAAAYGCDYGGLQKEGPARELMIMAMREVLALSEKEGVGLTENDLDYWLNVLRVLNPEGKPSMQQDIEAKRPSEVGLFAGTVLSMTKRYGIHAAANQKLQDLILSIENNY
ncbi:MAG TPA: ketopantoate reductase family protein [Bacillota bacterium]|nr:ketopantoate reductase family protein [Bacillota bacterium]